MKDEGSVRMKTPRARAREALMSTGGKPKKSTPLGVWWGEGGFFVGILFLRLY